VTPTGERVNPDGDGGPKSSPVAMALRELPPPEHGSSFWSDLDSRLADEPQLRLAPRSAIRPITQPPPVIDDRSLASGLTGPQPPRPRSASRRVVVGLALVALVGLLVVGAMQDPDDSSTAGRESTTDPSAGRSPTSDGAASSATTPPPTPPTGSVDPAARLDPAGVGPLQVGATLGDLQAAGVQIQPDQATFRGSGGTCYDARVVGALDLRLRFRNPDGQRRATDPTHGVLAAISIESALPTSRATVGTDIALGASQDQVLAAYAGNLDERPHPFVPGGRIFRTPVGDGTFGTAFLTDGQGVIGIAVGEMDVIRFVNDCR
jgi:hypothetical protein